MLVNLVWLHLPEKLCGVRLFVTCILVVTSWLKFQLILMHWILFAMNAGKYAQVTNNPENDGCINAVLLV